MCYNNMAIVKQHGYVITENVWYIMKRSIRQRRPPGVGQLKSCIQQEWANVPPVKLQQLSVSQMTKTSSVASCTHQRNEAETVRCVLS